MTLETFIADPQPRFVRKRGRPAAVQPYQLVQMLADGNTLVTIAEEFKVTVATIKNWTFRLRKQHRVFTLPQLVAHYLRNGWID